MAYEVLARRWRPQTFEDVVGQEHVTQTLRNAIRSGRVAHAYLFVGPRGIGKTSIARIFAKALNCKKGPAEIPCGACPSCTEIVSGSSLDVLEIDGASNRGIDEIRALRERIQYAAHGRFRIYIVDEVHQLTSDAFNALLKTLEEPPAHVKFFFATTEAHKIPMTILSRCQRFDLRPLSTAQIVGRLAVIAKAESVNIEPAALEALARAAEGGLRDAESLLDQLIAFKGHTIQEDDVLSAFGLVSRQVIEELADDLLKGNAAGAMKAVAALDNLGKAMPRLLLELVEHFRNLLIYLDVGERINELDFGAINLDVIKRQAEGARQGRVFRMMDTLFETLDGLPRALSQRTWVETGLIRCARSAAVAGVDELLKQVRELRAELATPGSPSAHDSARASTQPLLPSQAAPLQPPIQTRLPLQSMQTAAPATPTDTDDELALLAGQWREIANKVGASAAIAKSYLSDGNPIKVEPDRVVVAFAPEFKDRAELLGESRYRQAIQGTLKAVLGRQVLVEFQVVETEWNGREKSAEQPETAPSRLQTGASAPQVARDEWEKNDVVRNVASVLNARIMDVKD